MEEFVSSGFVISTAYKAFLWSHPPLPILSYIDVDVDVDSTHAEASLVIILVTMAEYSAELSST